MKVVVGLGNPGRKYAGTRHNVGFAVVERLAESSRCGRAQSRWEAEIAELTDEGQRVLLVEPQTFMNQSGLAVRRIVDFYQVPLEDLLIVCDDMSLPLGKLRLRARGTHGGHNGLRDIQAHLGTTEYSRLRLGVDPAPEGGAIDYVLGRFKPSERPVIDDAVAQAAEAVMTWVHHGPEFCMNKYNA